MIQTLIALLFAHALADFVFQTGFMARHKTNFFIMLGHTAIVGGLSFASLGFNAIWAVAIVTSLHLLIDFLKRYLLPQSLSMFLISQALHIGVIVAVASQFIDAYAGGVWGSRAFWESSPDWMTAIPTEWLANLPTWMLMMTGMVFAVHAGGVALKKLMDPLLPKAEDGIPNAGAIIGNLERGLTFMLVLSGHAQVIGFLVAAKAILGFGTGSKNRAVGETLMIGTLASFGWAFGVALITASLRGLLD